MKEERYQQILELLSNGHYASVEELSQALFVSMPTVRRDLTAMQEMGLVVRSYGGVIARSTADEAPISFREGRNAGEKLKLSTAASKLLHDECTVFLDESSTTLHIIDHMPNYRNILVITNSLRVLNHLSKYEIKTVGLGGNLSRDSMSFYGVDAIESISKFAIDIMFFSSAALTYDGRILDYNQEANELRRIALRNSATKVFLCDKTKFGKRGAYVLGELNDMDYTIVNAPLPECCKTGKTQVVVI